MSSLPPAVWLAGEGTPDAAALRAGLEAAAAAGVPAQVLVCGPAVPLPDLGEVPGVRVVAVDPARAPGMLGSFLAGWAALGRPRDSALFLALAARPGAAPETWRALAAALDGAVGAIKPRYRGKHGHPLLLGPASLAAAGARDPTRETVRDLVVAPVSLDVDDPGVLAPGDGQG